MGVLPSKLEEKIAWFEQRKALWTTNAAAINLLPTQVTQIQDLTAAARAKYDAAHAARNAAVAATYDMQQAVDAMTTFGADLVKTIKAYAETTGNTDVYGLAQVPAPAAPSPAGVPKPPEDLTADPNADGTVTLRWKGALKNQTFFTVWRRIAENGAFVQIGALAAKKFVDTAVPQGVTRVAYEIRAQRGQLVSTPSAEVSVNFGAGGNQGVNALRMAA